MNVTLTLDDNLVRTVRKIAAERETTLTGLVRDYLEGLAVEQDAERRRRNVQLLNETLDRLQTNLNYGSRTWRREDLYDRRSR